MCRDGYEALLRSTYANISAIIAAGSMQDCGVLDWNRERLLGVE